MTYVTQTDLGRLNSRPKFAFDDGKAWDVPESASLDDQLLFVLRDPGNHDIGWSNYQKDLALRIMRKGANPFAMRSDLASILIATPIPQKLYGANWAPFGAPIVRASMLGYLLDRRALGLLEVVAPACALNTAYPPVLTLADGRVVDALEFAALTGAVTCLEMLFHNGAMADPARLGQIIGAIVDLHRQRGIPITTGSPYFETITSLLDAGAKLDPQQVATWQFADGGAKLSLASALVAAQAGREHEKNSTFSIGPSIQLISWSEEKARRSAIVTGRLERLVAAGVDIAGDTRRRGRSILHRAAENDFVSCVDLLLRNGASPDQKNSDGLTADQIPPVTPAVQALCRAARARAQIRQVANASASTRTRAGKSAL